MRPKEKLQTSHIRAQIKRLGSPYTVEEYPYLPSFYTQVSRHHRASTNRHAHNKGSLVVCKCRNYLLSMWLAGTQTALRIGKLWLKVLLIQQGHLQLIPNGTKLTQIGIQEDHNVSASESSLSVEFILDLAIYVQKELPKQQQEWQKYIMQPDWIELVNSQIRQNSSPPVSH